MFGGSSAPPTLVARHPARPEMIRIGPIQVLEVEYADWSPAISDNRILIDEAETFYGLPFVRLDHLLQCKRMMSGKKHAQDVEIILQYLESGPQQRDLQSAAVGSSGYRSPIPYRSQSPIVWVIHTHSVGDM